MFAEVTPLLAFEGLSQKFLDGNVRHKRILVEMCAFASYPASDAIPVLRFASGV